MTRGIQTSSWNEEEESCEYPTPSPASTCASKDYLSPIYDPLSSSNVHSNMMFFNDDDFSKEADAKIAGKVYKKVKFIKTIVSEIVIIDRATKELLKELFYSHDDIAQFFIDAKAEEDSAGKHSFSASNNLCEKMRAAPSEASEDQHDDNFHDCISFGENLQKDLEEIADEDGNEDDEHGKRVHSSSDSVDEDDDDEVDSDSDDDDDADEYFSEDCDDSSCADGYLISFE